MKKLIAVSIFALFAFSCSSDDNSGDDDVNLTMNFSQNWDGEEIVNEDFDQAVFTNANGEALTVSKLIYLISNVTLTNESGATFESKDYNLVDSRGETGISFDPNINVPAGKYNLSFTFGFKNDDNIDGKYLDLNSQDGGWNVPARLGGGYHFMRLEGKFIDDGNFQQNFQYHTIRAADLSSGTLINQDTSFKIDLGEIILKKDASVEVKMNIAEWFKNPNTWNLNQLNSVLMPNFNAQIMMSENGKDAFTLGVISQ